MNPLGGWANFYVIVGSSAGALIGLQFVVMRLITNMPVTRAYQQAGDTFTTPTVVHFAAVLLLSTIGSAPWDGIGIVVVLWGLLGFGGVVYVALVARRLRSQAAYQPVFEDWGFHVVLPLASYVVLGACVTFEPGARTAWHTHPLGQTLIVTAGCGRVQRWGGPVEEIRPGDVIWFPPGETHWHGATPTTAMTHIAIQEQQDGKTVDWMEHVSEERYPG